MPSRAHLIIGSAVGLITLAALSPAPAATRRPLIIGHRGAPHHAPENTIIGFHKAIALGATMLEMDLRSSAPDRKGVRTLVIFHDRTLDRTTNCKGSIEKRTVASIRRCDAGYGTLERRDPRFRHRGIRVPTLAEVFRAFPRTKLNLEIKHNIENTSDRSGVHTTARALAAFLTKRAERDPGIFSRVVVSGFDSMTLTVVKTLESRTVTALLTSSDDDGVLTTGARTAALRHDISMPSKNSSDLSAGSVAAIQATGQHVYLHTPNTDREIRRAIDAGVDGIYTNHPEKVARALRQTPRSERACFMSLCI